MGVVNNRAVMNSRMCGFKMGLVNNRGMVDHRGAVNNRGATVPVSASKPVSRIQMLRQFNAYCWDPPANEYLDYRCCAMLMYNL